jgi:hypothetical protein
LCCLSFCPFLWPLCFLSFCPFSFGHCIQHNGQRKGTDGQATQWSKETDRRTGNTMTKRK